VAKNVKLLGKMRRSQAGYTPKDIERLLKSCGFKKIEGGSHTLYRHPDFPELAATIPRHPEVGTIYVKQAVELVDKLQVLEQQRAANNNENN